MKNLGKYAFLAAFLVVLSAFTSHTDEPKIKWMTLEEAFAATQKQPRKVLIDLYTDWCGWCKVMDRKTFSNPTVAEYVNKHYYAVKFNAESTKPVTIGDKAFKYDTQNRTHEVAIALTGGKLSYPTVVYLDEKFNLIQPIPGFMEAPEFHKIITFLGEDYHKKEPFEQYKTGTYAKQHGGISW